MELKLGLNELALARALPVCLRRARNTRITCTEGIVWLTIEGEIDDICLESGQSYHITANGLAILEAIEGGRVKIDPPPTGNLARQRHCWRY